MRVEVVKQGLMQGPWCNQRWTVQGLSWLNMHMHGWHAWVYGNQIRNEIGQLEMQ